MKECTYDATAKTLSATNVEQFQIELPQSLSSGETLKVTIKGSCGSEGFRSWLSDDDVGNDSNNFKTSEVDGFNNADFAVDFELDATTACDSILIKGPSYGIKISTIILKEIKVEYSNVKVEYTIPDPYTSETKQDANADKLTLAKGNTWSKADGDVNVDSLLVSQRFIADPTTIEYDGRLYVYGTTDEIEFDTRGNVIKNAYNTHTLSCISSADMVNWRDEGKIDVTKLTDYAKKSWAPTICSKVVNGKTKFFLYYTTGGDGIAMLEADSPAGPWVDPIGKKIIDRSVPTCSETEVPWLFDPGVFIDTDGTAYIYFGGNGGSSKKESDAGRICKLSDDMRSLAETPHQFSPEYYFEDNEINKIGDTYYYSYSTNWSEDLNEEGSKAGQADIAYYTADNPYMENATYHGTVFANPGPLYGHTYNNHHHMFEFKNKTYIAYHTTYLEQNLYGTKMGYRSLHIDELTRGEDKTVSATATYEGVNMVGNFDGTQKTAATTMARSGGITTTYSDSQNMMVLTKIDTGDWQYLKNVDFANEGMKHVEFTVAAEEKASGAIEVRLDSAEGKVVGKAEVKSTGGDDKYAVVGADLTEEIKGIHDLYFVFRGEGYHVATWQFMKSAPAINPTPAPAINSTPAPTKAPAKVTVSKVKKPSVTVKKKAITVKWKKVSKAKGYQVRLATNKKFTKGKKTYTVSKTTKTIK